MQASGGNPGGKGRCKWRRQTKLQQRGCTNKSFRNKQETPCVPQAKAKPSSQLHVSVSKTRACPFFSSESLRAFSAVVTVLTSCDA